MKKSNQRKGPPDSAQQTAQQPEKVGWIRKFCGRGIFRELWRNRYVVLRGERLYVSDKEVKDERKAQEVFDLADYERSEELRKAKSRSKKNHSRFTLLRCRQPGNKVPNLVFLAVSPEEKESWVHALNMAITRAKNRVLDQVTIGEDGVLVHPTRDRAKIPHGRRLPTRGHLLAVASTSAHGMLTLDLVAEEDGFLPDFDGESQESWESGFQVPEGPGGQGSGLRQRAGTDVSKLRGTSQEPKVKTGSLPRGSERSWGKQSHLEPTKVHKAQQAQVLQAQSRTPQPGKRFSTQGRTRCASMDEVLSSRPAMIRSELRSALRRCPTEEEPGGGASVQPVGQLQSLIAQRMQRAQELLEEMRLQELQKAKAERERGGGGGGGSPYLKGISSPRLHHLRGSDSPHSSRSSGSSRSRSSDSPRLRGKDSPRLRGRESPRTKAKRNRSRASPRPTDSPGLTRTAGSSGPLKGGGGGGGGGGSAVPSPPESPTCARGSDSSQVQEPESAEISERDSPRLGSSTESQSPSLSVAHEPEDQRHPCPPAVLHLQEDPELQSRRAEAERLLEEAVSSWKEAQEVLQEVKELQSQTLRRQRRKTYEKTAASAEEDTPTTPTSPEDGESETP